MEARRSTGAAISRGGVAHAGRNALVELHSSEAGQADAPAIERGFVVDAASELAVRRLLIIADDLWIYLGDVGQERGVTGTGQPIHRFRRGEAGQIVDRASLDADDVALGPIAERRVAKRIGEVGGAGCDGFGQNREMIAAIGLAIEEHRFAQAGTGDGTRHGV